MTILLQIQSSLFGEAGQSSRLANEFTTRWLAKHPGTRVINRDLAADPVPHLSLDRFQSFLADPEERTPVQKQVDDYSMTLIKELQDADIIVFGIPMYNFSIPSTLHAYFDHVARAGITFRYTAEGPEGLVNNKKGYVFITRGGVYGEDHFQADYLRQFLGFIGITDLEFVFAEGMAMEDVKIGNLELARDRVASLLPA